MAMPRAPRGRLLHQQASFFTFDCGYEGPELHRAGRAAVNQIVATGEALMERRLSEIAASEWADLAKCGAQTQQLTILRKDRTRITTLAEALELATASQSARLMINEQSCRTAVKLPATGLMLDDGSVKPRVRLLRPVNRDVISVDALERSHGAKRARTSFMRSGRRRSPQFPNAQKAFHMIPGLLLPVWNRLLDETAQVYRLETDEGERIIGRLLSPGSAAALLECSGADSPALAPAMAIAAVMQNGESLILADGLVTGP